MPLDILGFPMDLPDARLLSLAETARLSVATLFAQVGHLPSGEQWDAIDDLLRHLELAANKSLRLAVYLSAIPAGTGKTVSLVAFAKALAADPDYVATGMLIACNRVAEVRDVAEALAECRGRLCVIAGKDNLAVLDLGAHTEADAAQIVVTTQAALKETLRTAKEFGRASRFFYLGVPRDVVCWDEALAFNRPVILDADRIGTLALEMRRQSPEAATALKLWAASLDTASLGECAVPDFEALGVNFTRLELDAADQDETVAQAKALAVISGATGWVRRDNLGGSVMVSYVPVLPHSLMPVIVTDASAARGVHHVSYEQMASTRNVIWLKEAVKTYEALTLRIVPTAASRSTYRDKASPKGRELVEMAVRYVRSVAPDEVLIVSYKTAMTMKGMTERTIRAAIDARLSEEERVRVRHLTWGNHTATNEHKNVPRVLLMGLNFMSPSVSYAASGAALEKRMHTADAKDHPTDAQVEAMRLGMLRDATLQALLRGNARMGVNGGCGVMEAVVPQSPQTGLSDADWLGMFPGAVLRHDTVLMPTKPLRGRLKDLGEIVSRRLEAGEREMTNPSLYAELQMDRHDFSDLVRRPAWLAWTAELGLQPGLLKGRVMGLRRMT